MNATGPFSGKVALVTGAASGIGRASALAFARAGAKVTVADIAATGGDETVRLIRDAGGEALFVQTDVTQSASVEAMVRRTVEQFGRLDFAHNNAGTEGEAGGMADCPEDDWDRTLAVNLKGVWLCMKHEIPLMLRQRSGAIVNTASVAGLVGWKGFAAYSASKHAIIGLTKTAALDYARNGIRINAVCPGLVDTAMVGRVAAAQLGDITGVASTIEAHRAAQQPAPRIGTPTEVASAVLWLCSDAATFVMGHALVVDGGYVAR